MKKLLIFHQNLEHFPNSSFVNPIVSEIGVLLMNKRTQKRPYKGFKPGNSESEVKDIP